MTVISLYDYTGEGLKPWAEAGYECYAYDIQHNSDFDKLHEYEGGGSISYVWADMYETSSVSAIMAKFKDKDVTFGMAFPVCTDMAVSGAAHFTVGISLTEKRSIPCGLTT